MFSKNPFKYPTNSLFRLIEENRTKELEKDLQSAKHLNIINYPNFSLAGIVEGETLLHTAARLNRFDCLNILLKHGLGNTDSLKQVAIYYDSSSQRPQFLNPIQVAIQKKHTECEKLLNNYYNQELKNESPPTLLRQTRSTPKGPLA